MARKRVIAGATAAVLAGGATVGLLAEDYSTSNEPPTGVVDSYEGLLIPFGNVVSRFTGAVLIANLYGDGHVELQGNVRGETKLEGTVSCRDDILTLHANTTSPSDIFSGIQTQEGNRIGNRICDGDQVRKSALDSDVLPRYVISQVTDYRTGAVDLTT